MADASRVLLPVNANPEVVAARHRTESPNDRLRVAIVTASLGMAGAEKQAFYMTRALAESGVAVRVLNLNGGAYEDALRELKVECRNFGWLPGLPLRVPLLMTALRSFRPHIIQSVQAYTNAYSSIAGRLLRVLSIGGLRSDFHACLNDNGRLSRWLLTAPDAIAVNSRRALEDAKRSGWLDPSRLHYLPNAIDLAAFPYAGLTGQTENRDCTCICVARLVPSKRVDVFIRAVAAARAHRPGVRGIIVGYGPETANLRRLAGELRLLPDAIKFLGYRFDVAALLRQSAVFVFCSESEGTPNAILEAMAAGLPVITTPAGDAADVVEPAAAGYVIPFGDVDATARAITQLAESPALRSNLGKAGRDYVARNRAVSDLGARLLRMYADIARTSSRKELLRRVLQYAEGATGQAGVCAGGEV
jgi:glycosyltransferase involved in cell wall biosynthesis